MRFNYWTWPGALVAAVLLLAGAVPARADVAPPIVGVVRDTAGNPLPNARVTIAEINRSILTAGDGSFTLRALRPGTYHLDATLLGYATGHATAVVPESGDPVRVEIRLRPTVLSIEGINVTASPGSADPLRLTQSTAEVSGKELERNMGASVAQTLASQPGLSVRYSGPAAATPVIRGLSGERVLVLENGERAGDLSSTSPDHGLTVDPLAASRLEVVRGPASLLYGNNALGGVVNVITSDIPTTVPATAEGYFALQGESVNPGGAGSGEVTLPLGGHYAVAVRGGLRDVEDVRVGGGGTLENSFYRNRYVVAGLGHVGEQLQGGISVGGYGFRYGLPSAPDAEEAGISLEGQRLDARGRADIALGNTGLKTLRVDGGAQWYEHDEIESDGAIGTHFELNTQTAQAIARTVFGRVSGAFGVSGLFRQYTPTGEEALTPPANTRSGGAFVYQEIALGAPETSPQLQLGARYDLFRLEGEADEDNPAVVREFNNFSASAGISVPLGERFSASFSAARSFRAPTVEELLSNGFHAATGSFEVGDPDMDAETNTGAEIVFRARSEQLSAQLSGFVNRIDNFITLQSAGFEDIEEDGELITVPRYDFVQRDAILRGVEGQVEAPVARHLVVGAMGDVVVGDFRGDLGPLPFMPPARVGASVRWDDGRYSLGAEGRHAFEQDRVPEDETATAAYDLVNLTAGMSLIRGGRVHSLTLRVDNLFDEEYRDAASRIKDFAPSPGRNFALVYRLLF